MLAKWNGKLIAVSFLLNLTPWGLPHIKKGRPWNMAKSTLKSKFHLLPYVVFSTRDQWTVTPIENFALSSISKDQRIAAINTADGSTLGDNLIKRHQVDYMSSVLIPAKGVENDQELYIFLQ